MPCAAGRSTSATRNRIGSPLLYTADENTIAFAELLRASVVVPMVPQNTTAANTANEVQTVRRDSDASAHPAVHAHTTSAAHCTAVVVTASNRSPRAAGLSRYAWVQLSM